MFLNTVVKGLANSLYKNAMNELTQWRKDVLYYSLNPNPKLMPS